MTKKHHSHHHKSVQVFFFAPPVGAARVLSGEAAPIAPPLASSFSYLALSFRSCSSYTSRSSADSFVHMSVSRSFKLASLWSAPSVLVASPRLAFTKKPNARLNFFGPASPKAAEAAAESLSRFLLPLLVPPEVSSVVAAAAFLLPFLPPEADVAEAAAGVLLSKLSMSRYLSYSPRRCHTILSDTPGRFSLTAISLIFSST
mmetsp:Transcript_6172/g.8624  ORF Transcript_6172/g.8624 Transcript_6172/m.8624 type:complete len:202 (-) Transcript_6172:2823-3428(-)